MRRTGALVGAILVAVALSGPVGAQDWSVERPQGSPEVVQRYEEVLAENPVSEPAFQGLLREYGALGGIEALLEVYARRVAERPEDAPAHVVLARLRERQGQTRPALTLVERAIELGANAPPVWTLRGRLLAELGENEAAAEAYDEALSRAEDREARIGVLRELGDVQLRLGRTEEAAEAYGRIAELAPRDRWVRAELANILYEAGFRERALDELRAVADLARTNTRERADALREVAVLEEELGRYEDAVRTWESVRGMTASGSWLHQTAEQGIVRSYRASGRLEELLAQLEAEMTPRTRDRFVLATRARILAELGRGDEAVAAYRVAMERLGAPRDLALELGALLGEAGRVDEAQAVLEAQLARQPDDFEALTELAELLVGAERVFDASFALRRFQDRHWDGVTELWQLFGLYQRIGDRSAADRVAARILELSPDDRRPLLQMAEQALADGRTEDALATLDEAAASEDPTVHLDLIDLLQRYGLSVEAERRLREARARFPADDDLASLWLQSVRRQGAETALAAARDVVLTADHWDVVVDAFDLYWTLLTEAHLGPWAIAHYQAEVDRAPRDYRTGRLLLMLQIADGDVAAASRTLTALRAVAPAPEQPEEWVLATLRHWPSPEAVPLLRRLGASGGGADWRYGALEATALAEAGRVDEARDLLLSVVAEVGERAAGLFAVGQAFRELPESVDRERGCELVVRAVGQAPRDEVYRLTAVDCLEELGKGPAAYALVIEGLGMVREVTAAQALWDRLLAVRPANVPVSEVAERLRAALADRGPALREWLEARLGELR